MEVHWRMGNARLLLFTGSISFLSIFFFFSSRRRHTRYWRDWSSDVCSSDLAAQAIDPNDRVLLLADGAVADGAELERLARSDGPAVLTVPDKTHGELYERKIGRAAGRGRG